MYITVKERRGKNKGLYLPNGLVLNRLSARIISARWKDKNGNLSGKQLHVLFRAIKAYKKTHPDWKIVEVNSQNGETVEIGI